MAFSQSLANRVRDALARETSIQQKKMFGGIGFLLHGNMLVGVWKDCLIARIGADAYDDALREPHVRKFDITGRAMTGWVMIEPDGIDDDRSLAKWVQRSLEFVRTLPAK